MTSDRRVKLVFVDELGRHVLRARGFTSCWFLVPPSARLVGDLAHEIRAEFGLSATRCPAGVDLVLEQRHLVPSHDVRIVRDDDEIHVQSAVALTLESDGHNDSDESEIVVRATELVARPSRKAKKSTIDRRDLTNAQKKERKTAEEARVVAKTLKRQQKEKEDGEKRKQRQEKELLVRLTASNNHSSSSSEEEGDNAAASKKRKAVDSSSSSSSSESSDSESSDAAVGPAKAAHTQQREQKRQRLRTNTAAAPAQALAHAAKATGDSDKEPQKQRRRRRPRNRKPREPLRATTGATTADGEALLPPYSTEIPPVDGVTRGHVRFGVARDAHVIAHVASSGLRSARRPRELVSPELQKYGPSPSTLSSREQLRDLEPQDVNGALDAEQSTQHHDQQKDASGKARAGEAAASHSSTKKAKMKLGTMWKRPYEIVASIHGSEAEDATRAVPSMDVSELLAKYPALVDATVSSESFQSGDVVAYKTLTLCMETWQPIASDWLCGTVQSVSSDQAELLPMALVRATEAGESLQWTVKKKQGPDEMVAVQFGEVSEVRYLAGPNHLKLRDGSPPSQ